MRGKYFFVLVCILAFAFLVSAETIQDDLHLNIQVVDVGGNVLTGNFDFQFDIATDNTCSNVVYSDSVNLNTDSRGIISYYLEATSMGYGEQYYLCYYRNSVLIDTVQIARTPYSFTAKNVNVSGVIVDSNFDVSGFNVSADYFIGSARYLTDLNISSLNMSEYYTKSEVESLNSDLNNSLRGWVDSFFVRISDLSSLVGNWSFDKPNYYNKSQVDSLVTSGYVNSSNFWDHLDTPADILGSQIQNNLNWVNMSSVVSSMGNWSFDKPNYYNKTEVENLVASGDVDSLGGYNASFFMPLNKSVYGDFDFNSGWTSGGVSIIDGSVYAQSGYFYDINALSVTNLDINGSLVPDLNGQFDLGSNSMKWRDAWFSRSLDVAGTVINSSDVCLNDGTCLSSVASGSVQGPASSTDNAIARFNGVSGELIQNSGITIDDSNNLITAGEGRFQTAGILLGTAARGRGVSFGTAMIDSVTASDITFSGLSQFRFGSSTTWNYNEWAGIKYDSTTHNLYIGGPNSTQFTSNGGPQNANVIFDGVNYVQVNGDLNATGDICINGGACLSSVESSQGDYVLKSGDTMNGTLVIDKLGGGEVLTIGGGSNLDGADASIYMGNSPTSYGFYLTYKGSGAGNLNAFEITSTNLGSPRSIFYSNQDGIVNLPQAGATVAGNTIWHAGNDGSGSGLDADTLDGYNSSDFMLSGSSGDYVLKSGDTMTGDLTVGDISRTSHTYVRALAGDLYNAGFEAYGSAQGTGYFYVGQSPSYGGGVFYNGDGNPSFATGEAADRISFYRVSNNVKEVVFSYSYNTNDVAFRGPISSTGAISGTTINTGYGAFEIGQNLRTTDSVSFVRVNATTDVCITGGNCLSSVSAGSVGGVGTSMRVPLWNGTSSLNNSNIYQGAAGRIGIGTSSTIGMLTSLGGASVSYPTPGTGVAASAIHIKPATSTAGHSSAITFGATDSGSGNNAQAGIYVQTSSGYGSKMYFATTNTYATGAQSRMMIDQLGNVGVGTISPQQRLHVNGGILSNGTINATTDICIIGGNCLSSVSGGGSLWTNVSGTATYFGNANVTGSMVVGSLNLDDVVINRSSYSTQVGQWAGVGNSVSYQVAVGYYAGYGNSGLYQSAFGSVAGYQNTGSYQSVFGYNAGRQNTGLYQSAFGYRAGYQNTGISQTVIGYEAGYLNIGLRQSVLGHEAGYNNSGNDQSAFGYQAGYQNTGTYQAAIGYRAGNGNTGYFQIAVGGNAGYQNVGSSQTAVGYQAGYQNTGHYQSVLGHEAGYRNVADGQVAIGYRAGSNNNQSNQVVVGREAGYYNTGIAQVAVGYQAGYQNTGIYQTAIGYRAGFLNTGGSSIFIGSNVGTSNTRSNRLMIDNTNTATPLIDGDFANDILTVHGDLNVTGEIYGNIEGGDSLWEDIYGVATYNGSANVLGSMSVGSLNLDDIVISRSYSGELSTGIGYQAGGSTTGSYNTFVGYEAGRYSVGSGNSALGFRAGYNNTGTYQSAFGRVAGHQNTGTYQSAFGYWAGNWNTGDYQVAIGYNAGYDNTAMNQVAIGSSAGYGNTGSSQVVVGTSAGRNNIANYQTAVGHYAGNNNNASAQTVVGYMAGYQNTGGSQTAIGYNAGYYNTGIFQSALGNSAGYENIGSNQIAIGYRAGYQNTGFMQTAIGYEAGYGNSGANSIFIGRGVGVGNTVSDRLMIDNYNTQTPLIDGDFAADSLTINGDLEVTGNIDVGGCVRYNGGTLGTCI